MIRYSTPSAYVDDGGQYWLVMCKACGVVLSRVKREVHQIVNEADDTVRTVENGRHLVQAIALCDSARCTC